MSKRTKKARHKVRLIKARENYKKARGKHLQALVAIPDRTITGLPKASVKVGKTIGKGILKIGKGINKRTKKRFM